MIHNFILHFRPVRLPAKTVEYTHTWGLGGMSLVLFLVLATTGILMMFAYEPSTQGAYDSIRTMQDEVLFGRLVRNIHHWSANFLIVVVFLHLLRVFFTGGYRGTRQFNWIIGLALLLCVLISNFTGYLLPWDQLSYWAITISTGMISYIPLAGEWLQNVVRDGAEIGQATLINFYTFHTTVVPVLLILLMGWHFWRVRKARGVVMPRAVDEQRDNQTESDVDYVLTVPSLLFREFVVALCLVAFVMVVSLFFNAPLGEAANPGMSPNPAKAPWYFVGIQELLLHFHPLFAVVLIPLTAALALLLIPYFKYHDDTEGIWFQSVNGRRTAIVAVVTALIVTPIWIAVDEFGVGPTALLPSIAPIIGNGIVPVLLACLVLFVFYRAIRRAYSATKDEAIQASFVLLTAVFLIFTATGVWFRGAGMALVWPW
ncbi:MAG: cytochrome b N-terminal domain-containing protein [Gemmatimonadota bacterium]|nr:MAG: cytochrome b N-terminal domain-containing protein [Gemmatimonadota bacterium]